MGIVYGYSIQINLNILLVGNLFESVRRIEPICQEHIFVLGL